MVVAWQIADQTEFQKDGDFIEYGARVSCYPKDSGKGLLDCPHNSDGQVYIFPSELLRNEFVERNHRHPYIKVWRIVHRDPWKEQ